MEKNKNIGKYIAIGASLAATICIGAVIIAKNYKKNKSIE